MTLLTVIVAVGFLVCWAVLIQIRNALIEQSARFSELISTAEDINSAAGQTSVAIDNIEQHLQERFPTPREYDPLL